MGGYVTETTPLPPSRERTPLNLGVWGRASLKIGTGPDEAGGPTTRVPVITEHLKPALVSIIGAPDEAGGPAKGHERSAPRRQQGIDMAELQCAFSAWRLQVPSRCRVSASLQRTDRLDWRARRLHDPPDVASLRCPHAGCVGEAVRPASDSVLMSFSEMQEHLRACDHCSPWDEILSKQAAGAESLVQLRKLTKTLLAGVNNWDAVDQSDHHSVETSWSHESDDALSDGQPFDFDEPVP